MAKQVKRGGSVTTTGVTAVGAGKVSRSAVTGRFVTQTERVAAAKARVSADKKRNVKTADWIVALSRGDASAGSEPR